MVQRENKHNASAKFWRINKENYGVIFESGLLVQKLKWEKEMMRRRKKIFTLDMQHALEDNSLDNNNYCFL